LKQKFSSQFLILNMFNILVFLTLLAHMILSNPTPMLNYPTLQINSTTIGYNEGDCPRDMEIHLEKVHNSPGHDIWTLRVNYPSGRITRAHAKTVTSHCFFFVKISKPTNVKIGLSSIQYEGKYQLRDFETFMNIDTFTAVDSPTVTKSGEVKSVWGMKSGPFTTISQSHTQHQFGKCHQHNSTFAVHSAVNLYSSIHDSSVTLKSELFVLNVVQCF
jgi:hypothetical protein